MPASGLTLQSRGHAPASRVMPLISNVRRHKTHPTPHMRYLHSTLWLVIATSWASAFFYIASVIGGVKWIAHMGQGRPATMNVAMAALCLLAAAFLLARRKVPRAVLALVLVGALVHLFNGIGMYLLVSTNGHIRATMQALMYPFFLVGTLLPTNSIFMRGLVGNVQLLVLPLANTVLVMASFFWRHEHLNQNHPTSDA
jgi:hypothetical protein